MKKSDIDEIRTLFFKIRELSDEVRKLSKSEVTKDHFIVAVGLNWDLHTCKRSLSLIKDQSAIATELHEQSVQFTNDLTKFIEEYLAFHDYIRKGTHGTSSESRRKSTN